VHCTKFSPEFECQGHLGKKTKKCGILFWSRPLRHGPHAAFFGSGPRQRGPLCWWENQRTLSNLMTYRNGHDLLKH